MYNTDGTLNSVKLADALTVDKQGSVTVEVPESGDYKILVWDGIGSMKPLHDVITDTSISEEASAEYSHRDITFKPENDTYVSTLYLENDFGDDASKIKVTIDGKEYSVKCIGEGYTKKLAVEYNGTVTSAGIRIPVKGAPGKEPPADPKDPGDIETPPVTAEYSAFDTIEAEKYTNNGGISVAEENGVKYITECDDQDYAKYDNIGFEDGAQSITLTVRSTKESRIEFALGLVSGATIKDLEIPNTNGEWQTVTYKLDEPITVTQNVVFRFRTNTGESSKLVDIDSFTFNDGRLSTEGWSATASHNSDTAYKAYDRNSRARPGASRRRGVLHGKHNHAYVSGRARHEVVQYG